ncbi:hypothetical protein M0R19_06075 [Candidatus Pacearchaeota archaeon]|jgi:hypothetical protein|nr:hypothetical protein [Candidatus Pacearchaeota archaeon]
MKRKKVKFEDTIFIVRPKYFWKQCCLCQEDYKKEDMWMIEKYQTDYYLCFHCAPTKEQAIDIFSRIQ